MQDDGSGIVVDWLEKRFKVIEFLPVGLFLHFGDPFVNLRVFVRQANPIDKSIVSNEANDLLISLHIELGALDSEFLSAIDKVVPWLCDRVLVGNPGISPLLALLGTDFHLALVPLLDLSWVDIAKGKLGQVKLSVDKLPSTILIFLKEVLELLRGSLVFMIITTVQIALEVEVIEGVTILAIAVSVVVIVAAECRASIASGLVVSINAHKVSCGNCSDKACRKERFHRVFEFFN